MEQSPAPGVETPSAPAAQTSLGSKLMDVFIAPGEVFEDVRQSPANVANWLVPLIVTILAGIACILVAYSQPSVMQTLSDSQRQRVQKQVEQNKITQQQADQALAQSSAFLTPLVMKLLGSIGVVVFTPAKLFATALVLWLIGRFAFHATVPYMKVVEVSGLAMMISVLAVLVAIVLVCVKGNMMANLGPSLFISNIEPSNTLHSVLTSINLMTFWEIVVLSIGLGKLSGIGWVKPSIWLFGIWAVLTVGLVGIASLFSR